MTYVFLLGTAALLVAAGAPVERGLRVYKPEKCWHGYTLFCESYETTDRAEGKKGKIYLIDMEGKIVHTWYVKTALQSHCHLLPDGRLIYPTRDRSRIMRAGLRELDLASNVKWYFRCRVDHDFQVLDNGHYLISCITDYMVPSLGPGLKRNPYFIEVDREGRLVWEWRGEEHVDELRELLTPAGWEHFQKRIHGSFAFDWAHNNTLQIIPPNATYEKEKASGREPRFKPGNIIFSYRSVDIIGVIERPSGKIVWAWGPGVLDGQHMPHMLPNGHLLIFDNGTLRGWSRVIEVDPLTEQIVWEYKADPPKKFFSPYISNAQRLPNGNTLICEGGKAHLFEVTPDGEVVWDFWNPYRDPGSLHTIYRCWRYSEEYVRPVLVADNKAAQSGVKAGVR